MTTQPKEPLLRMAKRDSISPRAAWGIRAGAFLLALITGGLLLLLLGHNPITVYSAMISGAWGSPTVARETVKIAVPLLITSIGISLAFRMKFWNIGAEGQILVGAIAAGWFGLFTATIFPKIPLVLLMMASSMILGGLYGLLPAICKAKWGTNETLFTLMLNYIAMQLVSFAIVFWENPRGSNHVGLINSQGKEGWLPSIGTNSYLLPILIVLALMVGLYVYMQFSKQGYEIAVVGESENTAHYAGINVGRVIIRTMAISGGIGGLAGYLLATGVGHTISTGLAGGRGFTAIVVAWLGKLNPFAMLLVAFFLVFMEKGAIQIATQFNLNENASDILTGVILFFILGCEFFINYRIELRQHAREEVKA